MNVKFLELWSMSFLKTMPWVIFSIFQTTCKKRSHIMMFEVASFVNYLFCFILGAFLTYLECKNTLRTRFHKSKCRVWLWGYIALLNSLNLARCYDIVLILKIQYVYFVFDRTLDIFSPLLGNKTLISVI